ncbi:MAG: hypothetical protein WD768_13245 [Phycisphaeraceae bacterium]
MSTKEYIGLAALFFLPLALAVDLILRRRKGTVKTPVAVAAVLAAVLPMCWAISTLIWPPSKTGWFSGLNDAGYLIMPLLYAGVFIVAFLIGVVFQTFVPPKPVQGKCPACGYDLRGNPGSPCPECGRVSD